MKNERVNKVHKLAGVGGSTLCGSILDFFGSMRRVPLNNTCQAYVSGHAQIGGLLFFRGSHDV